jgi:hypothetical protein
VHYIVAQQQWSLTTHYTPLCTATLLHTHSAKSKDDVGAQRGNQTEGFRTDSALVALLKALERMLPQICSSSSISSSSGSSSSRQQQQLLMKEAKADLERWSATQKELQAMRNLWSAHQDLL